MRALSLEEVEGMVEPGYLQRGVECYDRGEVVRLVRWESKLLGEVGEGHRVTIEFEESVRAACSCPSIRRTSFCKHAAAVLVAWAKRPKDFRIARRDPDLPRRPRVRRGKEDRAESIARGIAVVRNLLGEFGANGLTTVTADRIREVQDVSALLRTCRLRRLSSKVAEFRAILERSFRERFRLGEYVDAWADLVCAVQAVAAIQSGKLGGDRYVETFLGKTWDVRELPARKGLALIELRYERIATPDGYRVETSFFAEIATGEIFAEKLVVPSSRRAEAKRSYGGLLLDVKEAREYPGFPPPRLKLVQWDERRAEASDVRPLQDRAIGSIGDLLARYRKGREEVLAPDGYYALVRSAGVLARAGRLHLLDASGAMLLLSCEEVPLRRLDPILTDTPAVFLRLGQVESEIAARPLAALSVTRGIIPI